jgi:hypothetical protein
VFVGEICGCLPPPGSPPGALSPVQARPYRGMPLHSILLTTEVLSAQTRQAHYEDVRHARDDGGITLDCVTLLTRLYIEGCFSGNVVFKQGYLFVKTGGRFSKRKRYDQRFHELTIITDIVHFSFCGMLSLGNGIACSRPSFTWWTSCRMLRPVPWNSSVT